MVIVLITAAKAYVRYENIGVALQFGHLANLPDGSKRIKVETAGGLFSRTFWLTFEATPGEIDKWIKDSKDLVKKDWKDVIRKQNAVVKVWDPAKGEWRKLKPGPMRTSGQPDWFNPEDLAEGELYEVSIESQALYGKVWVDRKNSKVYIRTSYS